MTFFARLRHWWAEPAQAPVVTVPKAVPAFDLIPCDTCEQPFYRARGPYQTDTCIDCELRAFDSWRAAQETGKPLWL